MSVQSKIVYRYIPRWLSQDVFQCTITTLKVAFFKGLILLSIPAVTQNHGKEKPL